MVVRIIWKFHYKIKDPREMNQFISDVMDPYKDKIDDDVIDKHCKDKHVKDHTDDITELINGLSTAKTFLVNKRIDEHKDVRIDRCPECSSADITPCQRYSDHYQEDIVIPQTWVTRFRHHYYYCPNCKKTVHGTGEDELPAVLLAVFLDQGRLVVQRVELSEELLVCHSLTDGTPDRVLPTIPAPPPPPSPAALLLFDPG